MKRFFNFLRTNIIAGLFLLLPVTLVLIIVLKIVSVTYPLTSKLAAALGMHEFSGERAIAIGGFLLLCLLAGLVARARAVGRFRDWLEREILSYIPGYEYVRTRMSDTLVQDTESTDRAILVRIDDGWSPAALVERGADGRCVVFVPDVPNPKSGSVYLVDPDQVRQLNVKAQQLDRVIRSHGRGLLVMEAGATK